MSNEQGEPMFCAKDVCNALGYGNPQQAVRLHVENEDKGMLKISTLGGKQKSTFINESGLYVLILSSKLESAKRFKHWVTSEVLQASARSIGQSVNQSIN